MLGLAILNVIVGLICTGAMIPLLKGKIGRNALYGFRTRETLASDKAWYTVNSGAAKTGVFMSIGLVVFGIVVALLPSPLNDHLEDAVLCVALLAPLGLALGLVVAMNIELMKFKRYQHAMDNINVDAADRGAAGQLP